MTQLTIQEFIVSKRGFSNISVEDTLAIINPIIAASKIISEKLNNFSFTDLSGNTGTQNTYGENQQKLDVFADNLLIDKLKKCALINAISSEENEDIIECNNHPNGYVIAFDPLDGSSNIDVNIPVGTIFSVQKDIYKTDLKANFLQQGKSQVIAGYIIYGSSTLMVVSFGEGTHIFSLNTTTRNFELYKENLITPNTGDIYSINESNSSSYNNGINNYLKSIKKNSKTTARFVGAMVTDVHRNLLKGGVFCYPAIEGYPKGKLRLIFEANPIAFIVEQAGGKSSVGKLESILELTPTSLHQRSPTIIGSKKMVKELCSYLNN